MNEYSANDASIRAEKETAETDDDGEEKDESRQLLFALCVYDGVIDLRFSQRFSDDLFVNDSLVQTAGRLSAPVSDAAAAVVNSVVIDAREIVLVR